jgi:formylglycine-generating enzyme required for sulfatase activity
VALTNEPLANIELIREGANNKDIEIASRIPDIIRALGSHADAGLTLCEAIAVRHKAMDASVVGDLIGLLASDDLVVRLCASAGLSRLTGQDLGYLPGGPADARKRAADKAQQWWDRNKAPFILKTPAGPEEEVAVDVANGIKLKLALVPAGKFLMGSLDEEKDRFADNEGPRHTVTISKPFYIGVYHVTQEQYHAVTGKNPSDCKPETYNDTADEELRPFREVKTEQHPVEMVSWLEAMDFCKNLSAKTGKQIGLPTEAQWEYACRAGSTARFYYGDDLDYSKLEEYGWYKDNSPGRRTHPDGQKKPNALGLFDMHGNVSQMCADWYGESYDGTDKPDPVGPSSGKERVTRGGSCGSTPQSCRCASRWKVRPDSRDANVGFRVVMTAP